MLTFPLTEKEGQEKVYSACGGVRDGVGFAKALKPPLVCILWLTSEINTMFTKCQVLLDGGDTRDGV